MKSKRIILKDYFYIIVCPYKSQNCGKEMKVINFGIDNYIKIYDNEEDDDPELSIELEEMDWFGTVMDWSNIPEKLGNFLKEKCFIRLAALNQKEWTGTHSSLASYRTAGWHGCASGIKFHRRGYLQQNNWRE